jgi:hypothetical protein
MELKSRLQEMLVLVHEFIKITDSHAGLKELGGAKGQGAS